MNPDSAPVLRDERFAFQLRNFPNYDKGRSRLWQLAWVATREIIFKKWWLPRRFRPVLLRLFGATVGERTIIMEEVHITWPWFVTLGDDVWIGRGCYLLTASGITIGHDVSIAHEVLMTSAGHEIRSPDFRVFDHPISIGNHVWIASRATILHRVKIPDHSVVQAQAVVRFGQPIPRLKAQ